MKKFNLLIKLIFVLILCITPISCHHLNNIENQTIEISSNDNQTYGMSMYNAFEREFTRIQFDSICKVDRISNDLNKWYIFSSRDGENGLPFNEYMYIKYDNISESIYRLIKIDNNTYKITKRIKK